MRKYFAHIIDGNEERRKKTGNTIIRNKPFPIEKGRTKIMDYLVRETGKTYKVCYLGLGYKDFESEKEYKDKALEVVNQKLNEVKELRK